MQEEESRSRGWEERGGRGQWSSLRQLQLLALESLGKGLEHPPTAAAGMPEGISGSRWTPGAFHPLLRLPNLPDQLQSAGERRPQPFLSSLLPQGHLWGAQQRRGVQPEHLCSAGARGEAQLQGGEPHPAVLTSPP